jgi:hypothetical protein
MKIIRFLLDYIDPSLKERTGEAIHDRYYFTKLLFFVFCELPLKRKALENLDIVF